MIERITGNPKEISRGIARPRNVTEAGDRAGTVSTVYPLTIFLANVKILKKSGFPWNWSIARVGELEPS
jgi:hypothetical protein